MSVINTDNTTKAGSTTGGTSTAAGSDEGLDTSEDPWCDPPAYKVCIIEIIACTALLRLVSLYKVSAGQFRCVLVRQELC
jgi:hypothetical protein